MSRPQSISLPFGLSFESIRQSGRPPWARAPRDSTAVDPESSASDAAAADRVSPSAAAALGHDNTARESTAGQILIDENTVAEFKRSLERRSAWDEIALRQQWVHDPVEWKGLFDTFRDRPDLRRAMRCTVQMATLRALVSGKYAARRDDNGAIGPTVLLDRRKLESSVRKTVMFDYRVESQHLQKGSKGRSHKEQSFASNQATPVPAILGSVSASAAPQIQLFAGDSIEVARFLIDKGLARRPAVLVMASPTQPGGGFDAGAGAQEENIARRTAWVACCRDLLGFDGASRAWTYPLPEFGGVYAPDVPVFRRSEVHGYAWYNASFVLSFIASAAYKDPAIVEIDGSREGVRFSGKSMIAKVRKKICAVLRCATEKGHDSIVLGAWGCGAYGNPAQHVAELFREEICRTFSLGQAPSLVVFAIMDSSTRKTNLQAFEKGLCCQPEILPPAYVSIMTDLCFDTESDPHSPLVQHLGPEPDSLS